MSMLPNPDDPSSALDGQGSAIDCTENCNADAINCTRASGSGNYPPNAELLPTDVAAMVEESLASNTRRAYKSDVDHFLCWGGSIPSTDRQIAAYLVSHSATLVVSTLARRLTAIGKAHLASGVPNPIASELVKATLRGIKRTRGTPQRAARPLLREDLFKVLDAIGSDPKDLRDRALLLIGFAGGLRRSELVSLDFIDIERVRQGVVLSLRRSKTDQFGVGRKIGVPFGRSRWCPVRALDEWTVCSRHKSGALFVSVDRHHNVGPGRLSGEAVSIIVKSRAAKAGFSSELLSGHSLRAGFATSAVMAGASTYKIRQQTGHASDAMLARYIRDGDMFTDNAAGVVL